MLKSTVALVFVGQKLFLPTYFTTQLLLLFMHLTSFFSTIYRSRFLILFIGLIFQPFILRGIFQQNIMRPS